MLFDRAGGFFAEETTFTFGFIFEAVVAFGCRQQTDIVLRRDTDIFFRQHLRCLAFDVMPGHDNRVATAGNFRALLANVVVNDGVFILSDAIARRCDLGQQIDITPSLQTCQPTGLKTGSLAGQIPACGQDKAISGANTAAIRRRAVGSDCTVTANIFSLSGIQRNIVARRQRCAFCHVDIAGINCQVITCRNIQFTA